MADRSAAGADVLLPPPLFYFLSTGLGWLLERFVPLRVELGEPFRTGLGAVFGALGLLLIFTSVRWFHRTGQALRPWKETPQIISVGPYRWTRNPMYLGMTMIQCWIGVALASGWILLLVLGACAAAQRWAIVPEEEYLTRRFGDAYLQYRTSVRRWF